MLSLGLLACAGCSAGATSPRGDGGPSATDGSVTTLTDAGRKATGTFDGEVADTGPSISADTGAPDAGHSKDSGATASGEAGAEYDPTIVTAAIQGLNNNAWSWVPIDGALCRDGSATGIGVYLNTASPNLMIYLEGGGSCDEAKKCAPCEGQTSMSADGGACTPLNYDETQFQAFASGAHTGSIFDRSLATNPVKDWNVVYVPYCTGDQHGGNALDTDPPDYTIPQDFVGYVDMTLALARIVPTFSSVTKVLLSGESAGGAGVQLNYIQTAKAFGSVTVDALDDSGPPMPNPYLADCEQAYWTKLFHFDRTWMKDCGPDCQPGMVPDGGGAVGLAAHMAATYPQSTFGVVDAMWDSNISANYGAGNYGGVLDDCEGFQPDAGPYRESQAMFGAGQYATRSSMAAYPNFGTFLFSGDTHTTIGRTKNEETSTDLDFGDRTTATDAGTLAVTTWVGNLVNGAVTNAGP